MFLKGTIVGVGVVTIMVGLLVGSPLVFAAPEGSRPGPAAIWAAIDLLQAELGAYDQKIADLEARVAELESKVQALEQSASGNGESNDNSEPDFDSMPDCDDGDPNTVDSAEWSRSEWFCVHVPI
jgi:hypothetical protein